MKCVELLNLLNDSKGCVADMDSKRNMPVGVDDFKALREKYYFVDKTEFLREIIDGHSAATLITRPRRFGKTMTMSMLYYFFTLEKAEENRELFRGCKIAEAGAAYLSEQGKYPVIFVSLKDIKARSWEMSLELLQNALAKLYGQFSYLENSEKLLPPERNFFHRVFWGEATEAACMDALSRLVAMLEKHHGRKAILLIDEYDVLIQSAWEHGFYEEAIAFMRNFLSAALKSNPSLEFAVLTGVLRVAKESIFSSLNNLEVSSVVHGRFSDVMGFTREEVSRMARDLGREDKLEELRSWYDGYSFSGVEIYNPWSVINYFQQNCEPRAYWINTSGNRIIGDLMGQADPEDTEKLLGLLQGKSFSLDIDEGVIYTDIYRNKSALYTMLLTTGYLKAIHTELEDCDEYVCEVKIPNREIRTVYRKEILNRFGGSMEHTGLQEILRHLTRGETDKFARGLERYLAQIASFHDTANGEAFYHGFLLGLTAWLLPRYEIQSNRESGYGRFDLAAFPRKPGQRGILIECKVAPSEEEMPAKAREALGQIIEKDYMAEFRARGVQEVWRYGVAFCGKKACMARG